MFALYIFLKSAASSSVLTEGRRVSGDSLDHLVARGGITDSLLLIQLLVVFKFFLFLKGFGLGSYKLNLLLT